MIEMKFFAENKLDNYALIEGFPGAGLVGPMTNSYIIEKLDMEYIGYIWSDLFPPIAAVHDKTPMFPVRIYKSDKYKLVVVISEFAIPSEIISDLSNEILSFVKKYGIKQIISIGGIPTQKPNNIAYALSSSQEMLKYAINSGMQPIEEGVIAGVSALLLVNGMQLHIDVTDILIQVDPTVMDPKYAEPAIAALNKLLHINIDIADLEKEAKLVEAKVREILKKTRESHETYKKAVDATGPSMYA